MVISANFQAAAKGRRPARAKASPTANMNIPIEPRHVPDQPGVGRGHGFEGNWGVDAPWCGASTALSCKAAATSSQLLLGEQQVMLSRWSRA